MFAKHFILFSCGFTNVQIGKYANLFVALFNRDAYCFLQYITTAQNSHSLYTYSTSDGIVFLSIPFHSQKKMVSQDPGSRIFSSKTRKNTLKVTFVKIFKNPKTFQKFPESSHRWSVIFLV